MYVTCGVWDGHGAFFMMSWNSITYISNRNGLRTVPFFQFDAGLSFALIWHYGFVPYQGCLRLSTLSSGSFEGIIDAILYFRYTYKTRNHVLSFVNDRQTVTVCHSLYIIWWCIGGHGSFLCPETKPDDAVSAGVSPSAANSCHISKSQVLPFARFLVKPLGRHHWHHNNEVVILII